MPAPTVLYTIILEWLYAMGCVTHETSRRALAVQVTAVLSGQSLQPSARMRALLSAVTVPARQRYLRVARALDRPSLSPERLTPFLVRAVLALVAPDKQGYTHVAMDTVRCGNWEILTLGIVWHSRMVPIGWAVLPYPWPKGQFTPTVGGLVQQVAQAWPKDRPAHLLADRGFPSNGLFATLKSVGWDWTIRLQARNWVVVEGKCQPVRELLAPTPLGTWNCTTGTFGSRKDAVIGQLVIGRPKRYVPSHQRNPSSQDHWQRQQERRAKHIASKHPRQAPDASVETAGWLVLFTSLSSHRYALSSYRRRWATEGSYRDAQGGWDGKHGWDLEPVAAATPTSEAVTRLVGLWALSALIQMWVGDQVMHGPAPVRAVPDQWATTHRLSIWARGRMALTDPTRALETWLKITMNRGAHRIASAPDPSPKGQVYANVA